MFFQNYSVLPSAFFHPDSNVVFNLKKNSTFSRKFSKFLFHFPFRALHYRFNRWSANVTSIHLFFISRNERENDFPFGIERNRERIIDDHRSTQKAANFAELKRNIGARYWPLRRSESRSF